MSTPVLHLIAGPNGAGKTTFYEEILYPATWLPFINADLIAQRRWPEDPLSHAYEAAAQAAELRRSAIEERRSFITETVFSHPSKLDLLRSAAVAGYHRSLYVIMIPEELAVRRVGIRIETGGHAVPEEKIRSRYRRLWGFVRQAIALADQAEILDNSRASNAFRPVARYFGGRMVGSTHWPPWVPTELKGG